MQSPSPALASPSAAEANAHVGPVPLLRRLLPWAVALLFFAAAFPTLDWLEFSNGPENAVTATALQMRRGGPWLMPMLQDEQRTKKPPLAAWIAAAAIRPATVAAISQRDPQARTAAYKDLSRQVRLTALLSACLMLVAVYGLGNALGNPTIGLVSALVCGSSVMFVSVSRAATTDLQLALWVVVANWMLAEALLKGRPWRGCVFAGVALGLAFMSKGPVAFAQTLLPFGLFIAYRKWLVPRKFSRSSGTIGPTAESETAPPGKPGWPRIAGPIAAGLIALLAVGLPWYVLVWRNVPGVMGQWVKEVTRKGLEDVPRGNVLAYLALFPYLLPWMGFFVFGMVESARAVARRERNPIVLALLLTVVPILVMIFFPDRKERYLLPMLGPASVLTGWAVITLEGVREDRLRQSIVHVHWVMLGTIALVIPLAAMIGFPSYFRNVSGGPWFGKTFGMAMVLFAAMLLLAGVALLRRRRWALVATTVVMVLFLQTVYFAGYRTSEGGVSTSKPLADAIWAAEPTATVYSHRSRNKLRRAPQDLSIYLNRVMHRALEISDVPPPDGPQVLVVSLPPDGTEPAPPGWQRFDKVLCGDTWWYAFRRRP